MSPTTKATSDSDRLVRDSLLRAARSAEANAGYHAGRGHVRAQLRWQETADRLYSLADHWRIAEQLSLIPRRELSPEMTT